MWEFFRIPYLSYLNRLLLLSFPFLLLPLLCLVDMQPTMLYQSCSSCSIPYLLLFSYRLSYSFSMKSHENDEIDLEGGKLVKDKDKPTRSKGVIRIQNQALFSGIAYCISSCSMILVNKYVLSSYDFNAGISLMLYQVIFRSCVLFNLSFFCVWIFVGFLPAAISLKWGWYL